MQIAERFGKTQTSADLKFYQMVQMLALPEGEEEKFIAEKATEGISVEDMTVKIKCNYFLLPKYFAGKNA